VKVTLEDGLLSLSHNDQTSLLHDNNNNNSNNMFSNLFDIKINNWTTYTRLELFLYEANNENKKTIDKIFNVVQVDKMKASNVPQVICFLLWYKIFCLLRNFELTNKMSKLVHLNSKILKHLETYILITLITATKRVKFHFSNIIASPKKKRER